MTKTHRHQSTQTQALARFTAAGQTHSYKVTYDPQTGKFDLWRDGASLGTWTDTSSPLTTGGYISLRTDASNVLFDNILMTRESKYYEAGGVRACPEPCRRVAMWEPETVFFLLSNHPSASLRTGLGSTATVADGNGNETGKLLYKPWGETRYSSGSTPTSDPSLHSGLHRPAGGCYNRAVLLRRPV
ncbi:MAG: hypothetical protein K1X65_22070 [Caldilineales bacterium]|nr:hypothetical protein [Caldilineales bacterium]